jgi:cell division protein FtsQ
MLWEDEPPAQLRVRRMQSATADAPLPGRVRRGGPGMPLEMEDFDDEDVGHGVRRFHASAPQRPWWRPAGKVGRTFLAFSALAVLCGLTVCVFLFRSLLEHDARFRIAGTEDIQANGLTEVTRAEMLPVFGEDIGRNIFFVPLDQRRRQLEAIPWVQSATVMRLLPDRIRVNVVERKPVAFTRQGKGVAQQIGLVDANGVLLAMSATAMARHHYSFPVITGIDAGDPASSRKARMALYLRMMSDLDSTGQHDSQQISEIDLTDPEDARVLMPEQGAEILVHFGEDHFLERYERYQAHIAEWRQQYPHLAAVDLRYGQQVVLEMASGKETSDPTAETGVDAKPDAGRSATGRSAKPRSGNGASAAKRKTDKRKKRAKAQRPVLTPSWNNAELPGAEPSSTPSIARLEPTAAGGA